MRVDLTRGTAIKADGTVDSLTGIEAAVGTAGDDNLAGDRGANALLGGDGADTLNGRNGQDSLFGGDGQDRSVFAAARDTPPATPDVVFDLVRGEDRIDLLRIDARPSERGDQAFVFLSTDPFSGREGELRYDLEAFQLRVSFDVDGDAVADGAILLFGVTALDAADFLL